MKSDQLRMHILAADLAWIPAALASEQGIQSLFSPAQPALNPAEFASYFVCAVMGWILLSEHLRLDGFRGGWRLPSVISHLLLAVAILSLLFLAFDTALGVHVTGSSLCVLSFLLLLGFLCIRGIALQVLSLRYRRGEVNHVVILGSGRLAAELAAKFEDHPEFMCKVVGFLCPTTEFAPEPGESATAPRAVSTVEVIDLLREERVDEIVLAHTPATQEILQLIALCRQRFITVSLIPQPYELYLSQPRLADLGGLPLLQLGDSFAPVPAGMAKRALDVGLSLALATLTVPLILVSGFALRLSTGKAFRWEQRIGRNGSQFSMLRLNVERASSNQKSSFLARFSIAELPQFWNVLRGQMSLVGPRPEGPERANQYSEWQRQRLTVRPGMTGLAQVHGLREQHSSEEKTRLDLQYMLRPSLLNDLSLLIETAWTLALRVIKIPEDVLSGHSPKMVEGNIASIASSPNLRSFAEILQHAHRAQSGSD